MKQFLCVVSLTLLFTTLTEGSTFRHPARNQLKNSFIPALKKTNHKTPSGKYENIIIIFSLSDGGIIKNTIIHL